MSGINKSHLGWDTATTISITAANYARSCDIMGWLRACSKLVHEQEIFMRKFRSRQGQSTTEYMLLISVIVIAVVAAGYAFLGGFQDGVDALGTEVSKTLNTGHIR